jgi:hypothetical protein
MLTDETEGHMTFGRLASESGPVRRSFSEGGTHRWTIAAFGLVLAIVRYQHWLRGSRQRPLRKAALVAGLPPAHRVRAADRAAAVAHPIRPRQARRT